MPARYSICVIPGDGIGSEVTSCAERVLEALAASGGPSFEFRHAAAGHQEYLRSGDALPQATIDAAKAADSVLVGAMDVAQLPPEATQPLRGLRRIFDVSASVRPAKSFPGVDIPAGEIDLVVVREVTQGYYSGIEWNAGPDSACGVRLITRAASMRTARIGFEQATKRRRKVTAIHKIGAQQLTDRVFLDAVATVAEEYPDVEYETRNVDACALEMVRWPEEFDVIVSTNAFGDILSDVAAGLAGGLGLSPSGCIGEEHAYFEPVHGTAPDIAGQGIANPIATILSAAFMLEHLGELESAAQIRSAVAATLAAGDVRTRDLGGTASSEEMTDALIAALAGRDA